MSKSIRIPAVAKIAAKLEAEVERVRPLASLPDAFDVALALLELAGACNDALDALGEIGGRANLRGVADAATAARMNVLRGSLHASLPPICGGSPEAGDEWPAEWSEELDGYVYELGETPLDVLQADEPADAEASRDWDAYFALRHPEGLTDADVTAAGLAVG